MKLTIFLLTATFLQLSASIYGQSVTLKKNKITLVQVFNEIREQTGYDFVYSDRMMEKADVVSLNLENVKLEQALRHAFANQPFSFEIERKTIIVKAKPAANIDALQQRLISGQVSDEKGEPLEGVSVRAKKSKTTAISKSDGSFSVLIHDESDELTLSSIGYESQEIKISKGSSVVKATLRITENKVDDVVVTGIFLRKKEGFTGSATKITGEEIKQLTAGNVLKALEMVEPNFKMSISNYSGSNPNAVPDYSMRGAASIGDYQSDDVVTLRGDYSSRPNQPLFVLDGVIGVSATSVMDLDPEQVESITLLKDAAATVIYGSEAANGVVVVETKKPTPGKLRLTYNGNYNFSSPDLNDYNLTNACEKLQVEQLAGYMNTADYNTLQYYTALKQDVERGVDTYWLSMPLQNAFTHRHGINMEGGDQSLRYKIYLGAEFAPGVMKNTDLNTKSGRIDIQYRYGKFMVLNQLHINHAKGRRESDYGSFNMYAELNPYYTPYDTFGNIKQVLDPQSNFIGFYAEPTYNPLWNTLFGSRNENREFSVKEALKVEYSPVSNLRMAIDFTLNKNDAAVEMFKPAQHTTNAIYYTEPSLKGAYDYSKREGYDYRLMFTTSYNKNFGENHLMSLYGQYMINENVSNAMNLGMTGYPNDRLTEVFMGTRFRDISGDESTSRKLGLAGTANYMLKHRYAFDFSMRLDASSQFGKNSRYAPFWSTGLRWNAEKEEFIKGLNLFDELVLRTSYGITGFQGFESYQALQVYSYAQMMKHYKGSDEIGVELFGLGNPDLKWQQTKNYNAALDFTVLKGLIGARAEYYYKKTDNTVLDYTLAPSVGFSSMKDNLGSISNRGIEFSLRVMPYSDPTKQAYWNILVNGAHNLTRIEEISDALKARNEIQMNSTIDRPLPRYESGYSPTAIWAVRSMGIDPATGEEVLVKRINGNLTNVWNAVDQVKVGDTEPTVRGTLSTTFGYRGFSFTVAGQYTYGGQLYNYTLLDKVENANLRANVDSRVLYDRWTNAGDLSYFKKINGDFERERTKATSRFVQNNNEFKISTINMSYRMDKSQYSFLKNMGLSTATIGLYLEDVARISSIKMERGIYYPFARQASMSINLMF